MTEGAHPIEIEPPDISPYRQGNTGVDYVTTFASAEPGPHAMISAVVHGNELCGAIALDYLMRAQVRPIAGKLTLAFMNVDAFERFDASNPTASRYVDEDFNRVWSPEVLDGTRESVELARARSVRPIVDQVDFLLDIHSMQNSNVPLMMCGPAEKGRRFARALSAPEHVVSDSGHAAGCRLRDYGGFADEASARNALLIECGQHWRADSVRIAMETSLRFLAHLELVDEEFVNEHLHEAPPPRQQVIQVTGPVTIETDRFRFKENYLGMEVIPREGTLIGWDGEEEIRTPYDDCVLIMPSRRLRRGESAVRFGRYVD